MTPDPSPGGTLRLTLARQIDSACRRFKAACQAAGAGELPPLADYPGAAAGPPRAALLQELIRVEAFYRRRRGEQPRPAEYLEHFPGLDPSWLDEALADQTVPAGPAPPSSPAGTPPDVPGYEVLDLLGRGGMGVVYRARQVALNRVVALKMIRAGDDAGAFERQRFRQEAEAVAKLQHPGIVQIFEVGEHFGRAFFSMEYCPGGSLADRLAGKPLPPPAAARLVEALARAVHHAHQRGVLHRDLKPANVLLRSSEFGVRSSEFKPTSDGPDLNVERRTPNRSPRSPTSAWPSCSTSATPTPRPASWSARRRTWPPSRRSAGLAT